MGTLIRALQLLAFAVLLFPSLSMGEGQDDLYLEGGNALDSGDAPPSPRKYMDDVLNSDYFGEDLEPASDSDGVADADAGISPVAVVTDDVEKPVEKKKAFCVGCPVKVDPEDGKIKEMASFAFAKHMSSLDEMDQAIRVVKIVNAMTQVVAGQKFILDLEVGVTNCTKAQHDEDQTRCHIDPSSETFMCNFEVVEQSWLSNREVVRSNCERKNAAENVESIADDEDDEDEEVTLSRRKRDVKPTKFGGERETEEDPEKLMDLAKFAIQQLDVMDADDDARMVMEVIESKKQTVSGWLYSLKVRVAFTTCKEGEEVSMEKCKDKIQPPIRICSVKILFQPWQVVQKKVTESQCFPEKEFYKKKGRKMGKALGEGFSTKKDKLIGGFEDIDITASSKEKELQELVDFVVMSLDSQSNAIHAQKVIKIIEAQRQLVSGLKTRVVLELGYTSCRKHPQLDKSKCEIDDRREHQFCNVTIWEQPWAKDTKGRQITNSKCGPKESMFRLKREKRAFSHFHFTPSETEKKLEYQEKEFQEFLEHHGKRYESQEEYKMRLGFFQDNMKKVKLLQENERGTAVYGASHFADLSEEEFAKNYLGLRPDLKQRHKKKVAKVPQLSSLPESFDWRDYGAVTDVKNQGMCGSCWAFSVTGNIEGLYQRKHGDLLSFSEQELVDCDTLDEGCNGGLPENAYKALEKLGGLETESAYPYDGKREKCALDKSKAYAKVSGFVDLPKNETDMAAWLVKNGPISIGINANAMQFYMGGVSHPWSFLCSKKQLDHGVLIVGFGVHTTSIRHKTMPYWVVKNSWGPHWGEKGYYRVYRGQNTCGLAEMATSAVVE